jgi:energy-coupling factor transport system substrate-specific component
MEKKSISKLILGVWNTKTIVAIAIGAALFGVLMNFGGITVTSNTKLTTAMIVPVIVGGLFGPVPALVTSFVGNTVADLIGGWGYWFDWSIGNGVLGFIVGLLPLYGAKINDGIFKVKHAVIYTLLAIVGNAFAFGIVTPIFTKLFYGGDLTVTFLQSFTGGISNTIILTVIGIPILFLLARRNELKSNLTLEKE